jgi:HK97 family phage portal protein
MIENIFNRIRKAITTNLLYASLYRFIGNGTPISVTDNASEYIEYGYAGNADVYSIINRICVYARNIKLETQKYESGEWVEDPENYINKLLHNPNDSESETSFRDKIISYLLTTGNAYIYLLRLDGGMNAGKVVEMFVMPSDKVEIVGSSNVLKPVRGYRVDGFFNTEIPAKDVIHIKFANLSTYSGGASELYGMSPLKPARKLLTQSNDTYTANMKALQNSGAVGILSGEKDEEYDTAALQQVQKKYDEKYAGPNSRGKVIISSKPLKWVNMGISPKDLQTFEGQEISLKHLCNVFNVPLALFNSDASTFNNIESAMKSMYSDCAIPLMQFIVEELNRGLYKELNGSKICLDSSEIQALQPDRLKKVQWMRAAGVFTQQEIRQELGWGVLEGDPILEEEMNEIYIPSNLKPLGSDNVQEFNNPVTE